MNTNFFRAAAKIIRVNSCYQDESSFASDNDIVLVLALVLNFLLIEHEDEGEEEVVAASATL